MGTVGTNGGHQQEANTLVGKNILRPHTTNHRPAVGHFVILELGVCRADFDLVIYVH